MPRPRARREAPREAGSAFRGVLPLLLVGVSLLGSVAVPAHQTWLITRLLHQSTEVLAPARLLVTQLQSGLAKELIALQTFALSGDSALLEQYRATAAEDARWVVDLDGLAARLDPAAAARAQALRRRIGAWHGLEGVLMERRGSRAGFTAALRAGQASYDSSLSAISGLSSSLAAEAATRDDRLRAFEQLSIVANAALVFVALVAMSFVLSLTLRDRRRARQETALRQAAEALAGAYTSEEVMQRIVHAALEAMEGRGAFVEQIAARAGETQDVLVVEAVAGAGVPPLETACAFADSYAELVTKSGEPMLVGGLQHPERRGIVATIRETGGSVIVVPLGAGGRPIGALCVVSSARGRFRPDDVARAGIFGHLASLAYEKVRFLEEANEKRQAVERVIQSRSRLIRGFSHDVKNPIGAADGFAALLSLGIYGELSAEQRASVDRMRRSMHDALGLIDDLHELGRAETGNVALSLAPVDLADLLRSIGEDYDAAARARELSLSVDVELDDPMIETDRNRVRQIASNLLSNAIKYTESGSVRVRALRRPAGPFGDAGAWAVIEFVDTGPGIPATKQDFIFEEFSRLGGSDTPGAGLGLAISKLLAQALGGHISVRSELGHGSTFTLWLPLHPASPLT